MTQLAYWPLRFLSSRAFLGSGLSDQYRALLPLPEQRSLLALLALAGCRSGIRISAGAL